MTEEMPKSEVCLRLAEHAAKRYESFRGVHWRINFGLWTLLAGGAALVLTLEAPITTGQFWIGCIIAVSLFLIYFFLWMPYSHMVFQRNQRQSFWWESHVHQIIYPKAADKGQYPGLPKRLSPWKKPLGQSSCGMRFVEWCLSWLGKTDVRWPNAYDGRQNDAEAVREPPYHPSHFIEISITVLVLIFFMAALSVKRSGNTFAAGASVVLPDQEESTELSSPAPNELPNNQPSLEEKRDRMSATPTIIAVLAMLVSLGSLIGSFCIYRWSRRVGMKPVLVFTKDKETENDREGWCLCNVGNGPSINVLVARRQQGNEWEHYRQIPTLAPGSHFPIELGGPEIQCDYSDIDERRYSSRCKDWVTSFPKKDRLPHPTGDVKRMEGLPRTAQANTPLYRKEPLPP